MSNASSRAPGGRLVPVLTAALLIGAPVAQAQVLPPHPNAPKANWVLFDKFSPANARSMVFSTNIIPRWIGETDSMFYSWKDHTGERWFLADARKRTKQPLFDHHKLATQLSVAIKKAVGAFALSDEVNLINITRDHNNLRFSVDSQRFNWNLATETLTSIGRYRGVQDSLLTKDEETDGTTSYQIVGEFEADVKKGKISIASPIARAIIGKKLGDSVEVSTPGGGKSYEIAKVAWS